MGKNKTEKSRVAKSTDNKLRNVTHVKGVNFYRDAKQVKILNMHRGGRPTRDKNGTITREAIYQTKLASGTVARVEPNKRWFGNTRVIGQKQLELFRDAMSTTAHDSYSVLLRKSKLPMQLLNDHTKVSRINLLQADPFNQTFGPKAQRKRPKLASVDVAQLSEKCDTLASSYTPEKDTRLNSNMLIQELGMNNEPIDKRMQAGQSRRIWNELYKVVDSSDVIIHVLDARDPLGTRCVNIEKYIKKEASHKHLIFVLNKCDLVPTWVTVSLFIILNPHSSQDSVNIFMHESVTRVGHQECTPFETCFK